MRLTREYLEKKIKDYNFFLKHSENDLEVLGYTISRENYENIEKSDIRAILSENPNVRFIELSETMPEGEYEGNSIVMQVFNQERGKQC